MNKDFVQKWLNNLKEFWFSKDIENAVSLFKNTTFYQETPFIEPYTTLDEIKEEWQHVKDENIQNIEIKLLAIDGYTVIAEWFLKQNNQEYDGIYEIKFNDNLECIYFKSWEMIKQKGINRMIEISNLKQEKDLEIIAEEYSNYYIIIIQFQKKNGQKNLQ